MIVWVLAGAQCCKFVQNHWNWKGEIHVWFLLMLVNGQLLASVLSFAMAAYLIQCFTTLGVCISSFYVLPVESNGPCSFCLTI